ncbi:MAG: hypothetical protein U0791_11865 [Gemmataceae bacterium]
MLRTLRLIAGAAAVLLASTAIAQPPGSDLFPLKKGSKWVYKVADQEVTVVVVGPEKFGTEDCVKVDTMVGGQVKASELYSVKADGVYRAKVKEDKVDPAVRILQLPAKKGDSWKIDSKVGTQSVKGEFKLVDDKVKVKVGATEYDAVLVEGKELDIAGTKTSVSQWFVAGKGIVKLSYKIQDTEATLELKEYTEGK